MQPHISSSYTSNLLISPYAIHKNQHYLQQFHRNLHRSIVEEVGIYIYVDCWAILTSFLEILLGNVLTSKQKPPHKFSGVESISFLCCNYFKKEPTDKVTSTREISMGEKGCWHCTKLEGGEKGLPLWVPNFPYNSKNSFQPSNHSISPLYSCFEQEDV